MTCREFVERATDYLDGALGAGDRTRIDAHLGDCRGCTVHFGQLHGTLRLVSALPAEPLPGRLEDLLLASYREWAKSA